MGRKKSKKVTVKSQLGIDALIHRTQNRSEVGGSQARYEGQGPQLSKTDEEGLHADLEKDALQTQLHEQDAKISPNEKTKENTLLAMANREINGDVLMPGQHGRSLHGDEASSNDGDLDRIIGKNLSSADPEREEDEEAIAKTGPYDDLEQGMSFGEGLQISDSPAVNQSNSRETPINAPTPDSQTEREEVPGSSCIDQRSPALPDGVRSIYVRHKGVEGDGIGMANELAGKLAIGGARGEVSQIAELKFLEKKLHPYWVPVPDAEAGAPEHVIDPKDRISTKAAISITALSGKNGLTQVQYDTFYSVIQAILKITIIVIKAILMRFYLTTLRENVPESLITWITDAVMRIQPLYSRSQVNRLLHLSLEKLKVRGRLVVFFETYSDKKIKKRKKGKNKNKNREGGCSSSKPEEEYAIDPLKLTGKFTVTQVIQIGDTLQREVAHPATEAALFGHVIFDSDGVPHDKPRPRRDPGSEEEGLGRCHFIDSPFWSHRQELFGRLANFGALADSAAPEVTQKVEADGKRVGIFRSKLFIQDSTLRLDMGEERKLLDVVIQRDTEYKVREWILIEQGDVDVIVRGEPFVGSERTITNTILRLPEFSKFYLPGDAIWEVELCRKESTVRSRGLKRKRSSLATDDDPTHLTTSMHHGFREHRAFIRFTTRTQDCNEKDSRQSYSLVLIDNNRQRRGDMELPFDQLEVRKIPDGWRQGNMRPITGEPLPKEYMAHGMGADGIPEVHIPIILYSDDTGVSTWSPEKIGGFYMLCPTYDPIKRTTSFAIRCISAATNKVQSDAVVESCVAELTSLAEKGTVLFTFSHGKVRVFVHVVYHICDFPQSAASTDVMGHSAHAHCSICGIRVNKKALATYAELRCSADISLTRSDARTAALRERLRSTVKKTEVEKQLKFLGFSKEVMETPFSVLQNRTDRHGDDEWPRTYRAAYSPFRLYSDCGTESGRYDSHQCSVAAIDHLFYGGCASDALEFQFDMLPNASVRIEYSDKIVEACKISGLRHPSAVVKQSAGHSEGYVNALGVGDIAACVLMASICLSSIEAENVDVNIHCYEVMNGMNAIGNTIYHTARPTTSTLDEAKLLKSRAERLVDAVADYMLLIVDLTGNEECKSAGIKFVNKPNLHRLLEFAFFWWPCIGFAVIHIAELIFEKYHQLLKQYALRTNNKRFLGFEVMQKMRLDECLKYLIAAENMGERGPMRLFNWSLGLFSAMIWKCVRVLVFPASSNTNENMAEINFMSPVPDRQWIAKGTSTKTRTGLIMTSNESKDRASKIISTSISRRKKLLHSHFEFDCLTIAEFGNVASFHHQLTRGNFVSGISDVEVSKVALKGDSGHEFLIPTRDCSLTESDEETTFGRYRFTLLICEIWRASDVQHGGEVSECIFVRCLPLFPRPKPIEKNDFTLWDAADFYVWKELDCSCRRIAGFAWGGVLEDGSDGGALIESIDHEYTDVNTSVPKRFVLLQEKDGYPSRRG